MGKAEQTKKGDAVAVQRHKMNVRIDAVKSLRIGQHETVRRCAEQNRGIRRLAGHGIGNITQDLKRFELPHPIPFHFGLAGIVQRKRLSRP